MAAQLPAVDALRQLFGTYAHLHETSLPHTLRPALAELTLQAADAGLLGHHVLPALRLLFTQEVLSRATGRELELAYSFAFFALRERGARNLRVDVAVAGWQLMLSGRFRLLQPWCKFMGAKAQQRLAVTDDTWTQVLAFSRSIHEDLRNYDPTAAWPVLLDEFVEELCGGQAGRHLHEVVLPDSHSRPTRGTGGAYTEADGYAADGEGEGAQHSGSSGDGPVSARPVGLSVGRTLGPGSKRRASVEGGWAGDGDASDDDEEDADGGAARLPADSAAVAEVTRRLKQLHPSPSHLSKRTRHGSREWVGGMME